MSPVYLQQGRTSSSRQWRVSSVTELVSRVSYFSHQVTEPTCNCVDIGILFTPISQTGHISWNVAMRQQLDIYASVVMCKSLPGFPTRHSNVDFAIIRENTEGEYSGLEHQSYPGVVESLKVSTRAKAERIARFAFDFALKNNRKVGFNFISGRSCTDKFSFVESDLRAQGQHHEAWRWSILEHLPSNCRGVQISRHRV